MNAPPYSRENPSPRFQEMTNLYKTMHVEGDAANDIPADDTFDGGSLLPYAQTIDGLVKRHGAKTLLDYGAGKAGGYDKARITLPDGRQVIGLKDYWGLDTVTLYDPGYAPHSTLPTGTFDAVVCTDVLEHCPEEDMDWILDELFAYANTFLFCSIACFPAKKILPNGENAHITLKSPGWWLDRLDACQIRRPNVHYVAVVISAQGSRVVIDSLNGSFT